MTEEELEFKVNRGIIRIPVLIFSMIGVILLQTGSAIWWASGISRDMEFVRVITQQVRVDSYTRVEAQLSTQRLDQMDVIISGKLSDLSARVEQIAATQRRTEAIVMERFQRAK